MQLPPIKINIYQIRLTFTGNNHLINGKTYSDSPWNVRYSFHYVLCRTGSVGTGVRQGAASLHASFNTKTLVCTFINMNGCPEKTEHMKLFNKFENQQLCIIVSWFSSTNLKVRSKFYSRYLC